MNQADRALELNAIYLAEATQEDPQAWLKRAFHHEPMLDRLGFFTRLALQEWGLHG